MSESERRLSEDRANRQLARGLFDTRLYQVKTDLAARGIGGRIKDKAQEEAFKAIDQGVDIAKESKGIIAATVGALALWFLRKPLLAKAGALLGQGQVQDEGDSAGNQPDEEKES